MSQASPNVASCLGWQSVSAPSTVNMQDLPSSTGTQAESGTDATAAADDNQAFIFTTENFQRPKLPHGLTVVDVPLVPASAESLEGYGHLIDSPHERCCEKGNFEIVPWPVQAIYGIHITLS